MTTRHSNLPLFLGLGLSLALHATLLPQFLALVSAGHERTVLRARFDPEAFEEPARESLVLGIDAEETPSTLTWIGYEEYREHLARLSETEQAAFRTEPSAPLVPPQVTPETPAAETVDAAATAAAGLLAELETRLETLPTDAAAPGRLEAVLAELADAAAVAELADAAPVAEPAPPAPAVEPAPRDEPADVSDLESDPTSMVEVAWRDLQVGKPLAAAGLQLKPRRPEFTLLTRLTAAPANPQVEIRFRRDGVPEDARIVSSSGDQRVDEAILNSLYRWRASGERLETLSEKGTFTIRLRIVLGR